MDTTGISASISSSNMLQVRPLDDGNDKVDGTRKSHDVPRHHRHPSHAGHKLGRGAALQVFRQELRMSLKMQFRAEFGQSQSAYAANQEPAGPGDVADEALGAAKQIVARSPARAAKSLISFRANVQQSLDVARSTVSEQDDMADVDHAVAKVDKGLAEMEEKAAATKESSSSVLDVDMRTKQRSSIKIRTQEGDIIKLSMRQVSEFSASSSQSIDGDSAATESEIEFSSRSRMVMKVRGDLNEAELGAIEAVIEQAQQMADTFFGGDIGAAFETAGAFEFDSEQLANVNMRFRMRQVASISYAETVTRSALPDDTAPPIGPAVTVDSTPKPAQASESVAPVADDVAAVETPVADVAPVDDEVAAETPAIPADAMSGFFEMVGNFLRSVSEGFEGGFGNTTIRFQHSESFKLSLLQSVIHAVAPDEASDAADAAVEAIGHMNEVEVD